MAEEIVEVVTEGLKAVQETAKLGGKAIDAVAALGSYAAEVAGDLPKDMVGIAADYMKAKREEIAKRRAVRAKAILEQRRVETIRELSPSLIVPLLGAAANEADDDLGELWSRLLANALDPNCAQIRKDFIALVKQLDPPDARVLMTLAESPDERSAVLPINGIEARFRATKDSVYMSITKLQKLGIIGAPKAIKDGTGTGAGAFTGKTFYDAGLVDHDLRMSLQPEGRELLRALSLRR